MSALPDTQVLDFPGIQRNFDALNKRTGDVEVTAPTYVTGLPSAPVDGQEIYYGADPTNGVIWHLRYRAAASGSFKWEFVGGAPMSAVLGDESLGATTGSWIDTPTPGPKVTVPLDGDYMVRGLAEWRRAGGALDAFVGIAKGAAVPGFQMGVSTSAAAVHAPSPIEAVVLSVTAATDVRLRYFQGVGATCNVANRSVFVCPVRVG